MVGYSGYYFIVMVINQLTTVNGKMMTSLILTKSLIDSK